MTRSARAQLWILVAAAVAAMALQMIGVPVVAEELSFSRGRRIHVSADAAAERPVEFAIRNDTPRRVTLLDAVSSCGCASLVVEHGPLNPGDSMPVAVRVVAEPSVQRSVTIWFTVAAEIRWVEAVTLTVHPSEHVVPLFVSGHREVVPPGVASRMELRAEFPVELFGDTREAEVQVSAVATERRLSCDAPSVEVIGRNVVVRSRIDVPELEPGEALQSHVRLSIDKPICARAEANVRVTAEVAVRFEPSVLLLRGTAEELLGSLARVALVSSAGWEIAGIEGEQLGTWELLDVEGRTEATVRITTLPESPLTVAGPVVTVRNAAGHEVAVRIPVVVDQKE